MCHRWSLRRARQHDHNVDEEALVAEHLEGYDAPAEGFWQGYVDGQAGQQFDPDAFPDSLADQLRYEAGYELGAALLARGIRIRWPDRRKVSEALIDAAPECWDDE
jgi:hypothetical protein